MTIIDTHTHFYDPTRPQGVPWPGKTDSVLYRKVLPTDYRKLAEPLGITGTIVVEASPWLEDNQWLLDLANGEPFIVGVVGRLQPTDENFTNHVERFAKNPRFRGIRIPHTEAITATTNSNVRSRLKALADANLTLDINGGPELLDVIPKLVEQVPTLKIVINHMANPEINGQAPNEHYVKRLRNAASPNVWCKLSALVEGSRKRGGTAPTELAFYRPQLDAVWTAFGEEKLIFGSNWPVSDHFATFATVVKLATSFLKTKGDTVSAKVFATNAQNAYGLTKR